MSDVTALIESVKNWFVENKGVVLIIFKSIVQATANTYDDKLYEFIDYVLSKQDGEASGWFFSSVANGEVAVITDEVKAEIEEAGFDYESTVSAVNDAAPLFKAYTQLAA